MRRVALSLLLLLSGGALRAQDTNPPAKTETVIVTADRTPQPLSDSTDAVTVIGPEQLRDAQVTTVLDALRDVAGLGIVQSGSAGHTTDIFLRGANPAQALVLVDGVDVNDPFFGGVDLATILIGGVERIEVVRGPQSPLYGSDAMAGVVNIITGARPDGRLGTALFEGGSLSTFREALQLGQKSGAAEWSLTAARHDSGGQFTNDDFHGTQVNARARTQLGEGSFVTLNGLYNDGRVGVPFNEGVVSTERRFDSTLGVGGLEWELHGSALLNLDVKAGYTRRTADFQDPEDAFTQTSHDLATRWRAGVQNLAIVGTHAVTVGFEQQWEDVTATSNGEPTLDQTTKTSSLYAQDKLEYGAFSASAGVRWDHHSAFGSHFTTRVSLAYRLSQVVRVRAAGGSAFRAPSTGELSYPFYGNPNLDPETSRSFEAGVDVTKGFATLSLTGFQSNYRDLITFDPTTFIAANIAKARIRGVEVTVAARVTEALHADVSYTYLDTLDEATGNELYRRPKHSGSLGLAYVSGPFTVRASARLFGRRLETDFTTFEDRDNPGYVKADLAAAYRVSPTLKLNARLENALDRHYEEALGFPAPGRTFFAGAEVGF
jgi:vitamin B12 transporter